MFLVLLRVISPRLTLEVAQTVDGDKKTPNRSVRIVRTKETALAVKFGNDAVRSPGFEDVAARTGVAQLLRKIKILRLGDSAKLASVAFETVFQTMDGTETRASGHNRVWFPQQDNDGQSQQQPGGPVANRHTQDHRRIHGRKKQAKRAAWVWHNNYICASAFGWQPR